MSDMQPSWIGRQISNRYHIEQLLGHGGMSSVFKATDPNLQREVAIKMIHPHLSQLPEFVRRFEQEAAAVAQLRHSNIVQVYDFNHHGDTYYMVLEYVPGETLESQLKRLNLRNQRLTVANVIKVMIKLCDAVIYAHEQQVVHRDLKPSNVIINTAGDPILMDFGIAKIIGNNSNNTATGATIGTAAYMAPEQVIADPIDERADIYSLGVILFEMLSGRPPYEGPSPITVMNMHLTEPLPDILEFNHDIPADMAFVLEKAMAKDKNQRFASAREFQDALRRMDGTTPQIAINPFDSSQTMAVAADDPYADTVYASAAETEGFRRTAGLAGIPMASPTPTAASEPVTQQPVATKTTNRRPYFIGGGVVVLLALLIGGYFFWSSLNPSIPSGANMVAIPAGTYNIGRDGGGNQSIATQPVELIGYWLDRYEVTNGEYARFLEDTGGSLPAGWAGTSGPAGRASYPVKGVSWDMAADYCEWVDKRLPSESEWEVAARGAGSLLYPWGDDRQVVSLPANDTYIVGSIPVNRSAFNVFDMAGNVWEWVDQPYVDISQGDRLLRGGSFDNERDLTYRLAGDPQLPIMQSSAGFRCAATEVETVPEPNIIVRDEFLDPESGWDTWDDGSALYGYHPPDFYHVQASKQETLATAFFGADFDAITMESLVFVEAADTETGNFRYGLVMRRNGDDFYAFTIAPRSGDWSVLQNSANGLEALDSGRVEELLGLNGKDLLRVDASGSDFAFSINGRLVSQITNSDIPNGDVGFMVQTFDETRAHIHYDNLTLQEVAYVPDTSLVIGNSTAVSEETEVEAAEEVSDDQATEEAVEEESNVETEVEPTAVPEEVTESETSAESEESSNLPTNDNMVLIDGGTYDVGDGAIAALNPFWLDQFEVTNSQFATYLSEAGITDRTINGEPNHPASGISWDEADAYCTWANKRLPSESEWVVAARGAQGWLYPWGNDGTAVALPNSGTYPVGAIPANRTVFGAYDMAGNVWEWVGDPTIATEDGQRVLRGGANSFQQDLAQRLPGDPNSSAMTADAGFRCAASAVEPVNTSTDQLFYDDFSNVDSGWAQAREPVDAFFYGYHPTDFYHMQINAQNDCLSVNADLTADNFMAEFQVFTAKTDTADGDFRYGVMLRQTDDAFYAITVSPRAQTWAIYKGTSEGLAVMDEGSNGSIQGMNKETRTRFFVIANGPKMEFFLNGELLSTIVDSDYSNGHIGFIINTLDETYAHIHFDSLNVWSLPSQLSAPAGLENTAVADPSESLCRGKIVEGNALVNFVLHIVESGESLNSISDQYNITAEQLMGANGKTLIDPDLIRPGQPLIIPQN